MSPNFRLVQDFIIPHLVRETYGCHLTWEDKMKGSFKISRVHQNNEHFSQECIEVYKDWSLRRNLWHTNDAQRITKAKHRLVTALRRNPVIETLNKEDSYYRFRLTDLTLIDKAVAETECVLSSTDVSPVLKVKFVNNNEVPCVDRKNNSNFYQDNSMSDSKQETKKFLYDDIVKTTTEIPSYSLQSVERRIDSDQEDQLQPMLSSSCSNTLEENENIFSSKCGCVLLLGSSCLISKTCIWHGHFP